MHFYSLSSHTIMLHTASIRVGTSAQLLRRAFTCSTRKILMSPSPSLRSMQLTSIPLPFTRLPQSAFTCSFRLASTEADPPVDPLQDARRFVPRRAMLYVPGDDERKLQKIPTLNADCVILECEDGVALNRKVSVSLTKAAK